MRGRIIIFTAIYFLGVLSVVAQNEAKKDSIFSKSIENGAMIYEDFCINCHLSNGEGVAKTFPPLAKSDYLLTNIKASIKAIKFGQKGEIIVNGIKYNNAMVPLGLTDEEIADVMNYITNSWGNTNNKIVTVEEVSKIQQ